MPLNRKLPSGKKTTTPKSTTGKGKKSAGEKQKPKTNNLVLTTKKDSTSNTTVATNKKISGRSDDHLNVVNPSGKKELSFFELVYEVARQIPRGRVTSYGAIAAALGTKLSARMVGWAMNGAHHVHPPVPAHRVVNRVGLLSGKFHFQPPDKMEKLLKKEGVLVKDDVIVNFKEKFWDPLTESL